MIDLDEILPDQESKDNFRSLCELYNKNEPIIIFYGAGLSKNPGVPTWEELLIDLCNDVNLEYDSLNGEYWDKASIIEKRYNSRNIDFYNAIRANLRPKNSNISGVLQCLIKKEKINAFITTNFDNTLSRLILVEGLNLNQQYHPDFNPSRLVGREIIYLHGNAFHETTDIVFTKEQYHQAYSSNYKNLKDIMENAYWYNSIVFLGFSFDDKYFCRLYSEVQKERYRYTGNMKKKAPIDYAFFETPYLDNEVDQVGLFEKQDRFKTTFGIQPISFSLYRGGFVNLEDLMHILIGIIPTKTISDKGDEL